MTPTRWTIAVVTIVVCLVAVAWAAYRVPRWYRAATPQAVAATPPGAPAPAGRKIKARLYYVADDGMRLAGVEREVPYGEAVTDQAREIVTAQLAPVAEPLVSAIPAGTALRALFITDKGQAFVDLNRAVVDAHPGGSTNELLTIYTIVDALTTNLPSIASVQILVEGKEVDTLAGHVDLRRPLTKNVAWVQ